ncbi:hypothetical protein Aduo_003289 [Ancylostoma duodenale]
MPAPSSAGAVKVPGPKAPAVSESTPLRPKTLAIIAAGIFVAAMLYLNYKKKKESTYREVFENKVINPARIKMRSRRQTRRPGKTEKERSKSAASSGVSK